MLRKIDRLLAPFVVAMLMETLYAVLILGGGISSQINIVLLGGRGPGGYYNAMLLQLLILFPAIYYVVKKNAFYGFFVLVLLNLLC